ncbi:hypothetical protein HMPREF9141_2364 [Prevotella multiformis DSM 16608]|uniref:Uncharacterized protein n=1 Tax=Prevotella multiformis DSM 16608 TaxID=888743 RepID=F0F9U7_9BACT|nr:hypothetical protein HMPREF9141_2364 [Prevotella multiformis DSM 16608]
MSTEKRRAEGKTAERQNHVYLFTLLTFYFSNSSMPLCDIPSKPSIHETDLTA